ncbi:Dopey domain containing protein [Entamoeba marina]
MRRNIIEDVDLTFLKTTKDKSKYIKFNEEAEKQLNQMEKCKVWTDILQMVQSFTKFIKSHKSFPVVPAKQTFMRRMAQALDPQIPSGVHNQVLDLFVLLFEKIGNERLSYDIWCFTPGLFPLIRTGATDIRIKCLQIVKTHLLSIIKTIPEMHRSLVVAVVVGMEENSSGIKDKTIEILDALKDGNEKYFWETCWDVLRVNPVSRKPLLVYLHLRLSIPFENNQTPTKEQLLYSVLNTLSDDKSLVLREMLDIVCTRMRLDSGIFTKTQMTSLLERMFLLLPKKDSGLTRRVHFYLLGLSAKTQDTQQEEMLEYFTNYSSSIVETALINLFNYFNKTGVEKIIGISEELLGKQVIGEQVIGTIIKSVVLLLKDSQEDGNRENVSKIIEFLSKVDATILFDYIISLINDSDNESRIGTVFSFLNSYQGDEEQMKLFDTLCVNTSMKTCDYLKTVIEENGTIEQIEECLNLIDFCLKDGILTIEINNTFHCFIEKYIKNDTEIRDTKFAAFLQFCEIIRVLHTELSPFKRKNIEICDISKEEEKDQEEEEEMGIESIEILMRKEVRLNGWINSLKDLITNHSQPIIRVKATKCYYDIWKKDERDSFDLNNIEFIKKMFDSLWDCLNPENYPILTDIVLFFHTLGAQHIQTTYDFITEKVKTRSEEQLCKYVLFWKHSTVLVYDVDTSPFNRALLFFLQHFIYENHDPFFHDFCQHHSIFKQLKELFHLYSQFF